MLRAVLLPHLNPVEILRALEAELATQAFAIASPLLSIAIEQMKISTNTVLKHFGAIAIAVVNEDLRHEIARLPQPLVDKQLSTLPLLNAVIQEGLRLYGAVVGPQPRIVPARGVRLGRYLLPPGTFMSTQPWTMHRDSNLFADPER